MRFKEGLDHASTSFKQKINSPEICQALNKRDQLYQLYSSQPILYSDMRISALAASLATIELFSAANKMKRNALNESIKLPATSIK